MVRLGSSEMKCSEGIREVEFFEDSSKTSALRYSVPELPAGWFRKAGAYHQVSTW